MGKDTIFDITIIGTGPAGIILALEFAKNNPNKRISLVEFGKKTSLGNNFLDDNIVIKNTINHYEPYSCTNKTFGGTSKTWGGRCVLYDEIDFIQRPILNGQCTWDLSIFDDVKKYIDVASTYFECGSGKFDLHELNIPYTPISEKFIEGDVTDSKIERWSMPTRFGKRYKQELLSQKNIQLFEGYEAYHFNKTDLFFNISLKYRSNSTDFILKTNKLIIAAGAQESTRFLLRNSHVFETYPKYLGKFYQSHVSGKIASIKFYGNSNATIFGFEKDNDIYIRRRFQFDSKYAIKNNLLNTAIWLDNPLYYNPAHRSGAMSFMYLMMITPVLGKLLAPPSIANSVTNGKVNSVGKHLINILRDFPKSLIIPMNIFFKRYVLKRKLPGIFLFNPQNEYALHFHSEQIPDENNKMYLDGQKLIIDYKLNDIDVESVISSHEHLDMYLRKNNIGELKYWYPKEELKNIITSNSKDGIHQSGTTRMSNSIEEGVVDKNLEVFGIKGLYVCSSSVFPTSSQANPTFMLGAFAVRLAKYLSNEKN
jgi:hypothetical protein